MVSSSVASFAAIDDVVAGERDLLLVLRGDERITMHSSSAHLAEPAQVVDPLEGESVKEMRFTELRSSATERRLLQSLRAAGAACSRKALGISRSKEP